MVLGLTAPFLYFLGTAIGLLLLCPITLLVGYFLVWCMNWLDENVLELMRHRR